MRSSRRLVFGLSGAVALAACVAEQPVTIDGSSPAAFERSAEAARDQLAVADRLLFDRALATIGGRRHSARDPDALARLTFHGMTAADVVADQKARE
jgi:hypothetical protein